LSQLPNRRLIFGIAGLAVVLMLTVTVVLFRQELTRVREAKLRRATIMGEIPDFRLVDQRGLPIGRDDLLGRIQIVNFVFTNCGGPCPALTEKMATLQNAWLSLPDVEFISISVDPVRDTPAVLADYAARFGAIDGRWRFLTGEPDRVLDLVRKGFKAAVSESEGEHQIEHSRKFAVVDRRGRIRAYLDADTQHLLADAGPIIRRLMAEN
jgi:cytochrome oxidase Cu insertion factor (SCO1/SenC/PrrC family)